MILVCRRVRLLNGGRRFVLLNGGWGFVLLCTAARPGTIPHADRTRIERDRDRLRILTAHDQQRNRCARNERLAQLRKIEVKLVDAHWQRLEGCRRRSRHECSPLSTGAVARNDVRFAQIHLNFRNPRTRRHHELHFGRCRERHTEVAAPRATGCPSIREGRFVDLRELPCNATHTILAARNRDRGFSPAPDNCPRHAWFAWIATLIPVQIFVDISRRPRSPKHRYGKRMLEPGGEDPWHPAGR